MTIFYVTRKSIRMTLNMKQMEYKIYEIIKINVIKTL